MNKGRRQELGKLTFKKRLKNYRLPISDIQKNPRSHSGLRNHGKPCSCNFCRNQKYREDRAAHKSGRTVKTDIW